MVRVLFNKMSLWLGVVASLIAIFGFFIKLLSGNGEDIEYEPKVTIDFVENYESTPGIFYVKNNFKIQCSLDIQKEIPLTISAVVRENGWTAEWKRIGYHKVNKRGTYEIEVELPKNNENGKYFLRLILSKKALPANLFQLQDFQDQSIVYGLSEETAIRSCELSIASINNQAIKGLVEIEQPMLSIAGLSQNLIGRKVSIKIKPLGFNAGYNERETKVIIGKESSWNIEAVNVREPNQFKEQDYEVIAVVNLNGVEFHSNPVMVSLASPKIKTLTVAKKNESTIEVKSSLLGCIVGDCLDVKCVKIKNADTVEIVNRYYKLTDTSMWNGCLELECGYKYKVKVNLHNVDDVSPFKIIAL